MGKLRRKCPECNGCMQYRIIDNQMYLYCSFCKTLYKRFPKGAIVRVENEN